MASSKSCVIVDYRSGKMNKRRRTSSVASRGTEDDGEDLPPEPTKRRKKLDPSDLCQQLYDVLRNQKKEDGTLLCDAFIRVPKRRQEPGYYEVVSNPIDLLKVQQKLKTDEYRDMDDLAADIQLMVNNAKAFYMRTSPEYKDATELWELCTNTKNRIMEEYEDPEPKGKLILKVGRLARKATLKQDDAEDTSESSTNPDEETMQQFEDLFAAVMTATDPTDNNRPLHTMFQLKPSKKLYPEYYDVIETPVDLKTVARKIQEGAYNGIGDMEKDLMLMCRNACHFNEPGSQIYKDAKLLKKIITTAAKRQDTGLGNNSIKIASTAPSTRSKRGSRTMAQSLIAQTALLPDEDEESDDEEEESPETEEADNPQWQLFQTIRTAPNNQGVRMSEYFWKLPSKRLYPDYYKMIKNPISLLQIRTKIKKGEYGTVSEVAGDMNIMFENAKKYNIHTSRLYKCAVKLQKIMQEKVQELLEFDQDSDSDSESENSSQQPKLIKRASNLLTRGKYKDNIPLKKRLYALVKCVIEYVCEDGGRQPMLMFMEKPSKKLYPDYYQVIAEPIDMLAIEANIKAEKYQNENELIQDFKLMFNNCRQYNEEGSLIYEDANTLEKVLMDKVKELGPLPELIKPKSTASTPTRNVGRPKKVVPLHLQKLRTMYDTIKDYHDAKGRQLSLIFMKLPNKNEYPDYYEVIKQPMNMEKIASSLKNNGYDSLDELVSDFILMFDNACKYNEPDSQIYKDALILQRLVLQTKLQLSEDDESVPDVSAAIQEILATIFTALYNHQDEEGRCYSDSMAELPEHDIIEGKKIRGLSLDLIKRRLDRGVYKRLDRFQEDVFICLERARRLSRTDSQPFEDSVELQAFFLRTRDEITRGGDLLHSPSLNYTLLDLSAQVAELKRVKHQQELTMPNEDESCDGNETKDSETNTNTEGNHNDGGGSMSFNQEVYRAGDFAYIEPTERGMEYSVVLIERLWTNTEGQQMLYGNLFYRPSETYHVASRKFLDKELFKSDAHVAVPLIKVAGRCCVLSVKDYFRMQPEGFLEKDVYVCESRYSTKARAFKKIKVWNFDPDHLKLIPREKPLEPKRVISVYKERLEKHKEEIAELEEGEKLTEKERPNVILYNPDDTENTYYEQYNTCAGSVKTGDFVYVATDGGRQQIAQVDAIWATKDGKCYFKGPWLLMPGEVPHAPTKLFYKQELFLSTVDGTHPIVAIVGKCAVLDYGEYICSRPTEIPEDDIYICESLYDESKNLMKKLNQEGLKKFNHSATVTEDEIYFFRRPINPAKVPGDVAQTQNQVKSVTPSSAQFEMEASPLLPKLEPDVLGMGVGLGVGVGVGVGEDSMDAGGPPSVGSTEAQPVLSNIQTPVSSKKKTAGKKLVTGYILYSSKMRTQITQNNPESSFGEISRIVGNEWRKLPAGEKQAWEERAIKMNEDGGQLKGSSITVGSNALQDVVYECCWDNCDWQFEDMTDCIDHCIAEQNGHVQSSFTNAAPDVDFQCQWRGCGRTKKSVPPFPSVQRLARHVKEVHILKANGRIIPPSERSKNYMASKGPTILPPMETETSAAATQTSNIPATKQPEPMFVAVPPRPSRVLHSDAYLRYIEGLNVENRYISNWDKQMNATPENTQIPDITKLPAEWLGNGVGNHGNVVNALWTLRNMMMRDVLAINKTL
ncbi:protein polybromo-1 isoform X2 [Vespa velutina]|uniref:protein polybromo-1 isoform X2 n=1 Tax=Vespa crabro TaxID=7445 RepID=UPI001F000445|nr:protein polybromo-1 isoform X2 [Vespa crabro]XP_047362614.1 protein polybromo-1 isoform X2 [Vespa velutina]